MRFCFGFVLRTENGVMACQMQKERWRRVSSKMAGGSLLRKQEYSQFIHIYNWPVRETVAPNSYSSNPRVF